MGEMWELDADIQAGMGGRHYRVLLAGEVIEVTHRTGDKVLFFWEGSKKPFECFEIPEAELRRCAHPLEPAGCGGRKDF